MKRKQPDHGIHPGRVRRHPSLMAVLGITLAACMSGPMQGDVIDDFENGYRFWANNGGEGSHVEIIDGQIQLSAPPEGRLNLLYIPVHSIPETETLTFTADVISMSSPTWRAGLGCEFNTTPEHAHSSSLGGYGVYRLSRELRIAKWWTVGGVPMGGSWLDQAALPAFNDPETVRLSLTRQGDSLRVFGESVDRATGNVLASVTFLDTPDVDPTTTLADQDNGAPFLELTRDVFLEINGWPNGGEVVFDNLACSHPPMPQTLEIERASDSTAAVTWEGEAALMESTASPQGPWTPCIAEVSNTESRFTGQVPLLDSQRFFALGTGRYLAHRFDDLGPWHTAKADVGAAGVNLGLRVSGGQASVHGHHLGDRDFLLRWGVTGVWWRDCVASVDVSDWGPDMEEGATFGIVLRAKPRTGVWLIEEEGLPPNRYIGLLTFNKPGSPAESTLSITGPGGELLAESSPFPAVDPAKDYRLRFWAVGDQLTAELFDLDDLTDPVAACEVTDDRCPTGIEALFVKPSPTGSTEIVFDNFLLWGVFTPAEW